MIFNGCLTVSVNETLSHDETPPDRSGLLGGRKSSRRHFVCKQDASTALHRSLRPAVAKFGLLLDCQPPRKRVHPSDGASAAVTCLVSDRLSAFVAYSERQLL